LMSSWVAVLVEWVGVFLGMVIRVRVDDGWGRNG
jgi:hypothetical protein